MNIWRQTLQHADPAIYFLIKSLITLTWGVWMMLRAWLDPASLLQFPAFRAMEYAAPLGVCGAIAVVVASAVLVFPDRRLGSLIACGLLSWFWLWLASCYTFAATATPTIAVFLGGAVGLSWAMVRKIQQWDRT